MAYTPTEIDIAWMKLMVSKLTIGGIWGYKDRAISFKRVGESAMALIKGDDRDPDIKEQIERNIVVMTAAGIDFVDRRSQQTTYVFRVKASENR